MTLRQTSNYGCFTYNAEQRPVDPNHVKNIMESMGLFGFLPSKPVQCMHDGKRMIIIDGHHRFVAAKNLGIPVFYVVEPQCHAESMSRVNGLQKPWLLKNFLDQYVKRDIPAYKELAAYHELGFPIIQAAKMLEGLSGCATGSGKLSSTGKSIREGTFQIKTREKIEIIASFIREHGHKNKAFRTTNFIGAFELCLRFSNFDPDQMTRKLSANPQMITRTASLDQMLDQFEEVYNWKQQVKVPLAFSAKQLRKR